MAKLTKNIISLFEHQSLKVGQHYNGVCFTERHRRRLEQFYGNGLPYYSLLHKGVRFGAYVGVLQVGELTIEILPKADQYGEPHKWRSILIGMLHATRFLKVKAPSSARLALRSNSILHLYIELFVTEIEELIRRGLIRQYRKTEGNQLALKGQLHFAKHIQHNLIHQERFYVKHYHYDKQHLIHQLLYQAIILLKNINNDSSLISRINRLLFDFPAFEIIKVTASSFHKIVLTRKSKAYENALDIARLLLLNYHPDLNKGNDNVLALMFDMNRLWEQFLYVSLRKHLPPGFTIKPKPSQPFWQSQDGTNTRLLPDIVLEKEGAANIVLDAKWKNIGDQNPSVQDLRQLYVYHDYYQAQKVALVYPGSTTIAIKAGQFYTPNGSLSPKECSVLTLPCDDKIARWQQRIAQLIFEDWNSSRTEL